MKHLVSGESNKDSETIAKCAVKASYDINAKLIIVFTYSGKSARTVAHNKPKCPILAVTPNEWSANNLLLFGGMHSMIVGSLIGRESLQNKVIEEARARGLLSKFPSR
jgi:pyruvate kinase